MENFLNSLCNLQMDQPGPKAKDTLSTSDLDNHLIFRMYDEEKIYDQNDSNIHFFSDAINFEPEEPNLVDMVNTIVSPQNNTPKQKENISGKKAKKNSNAIKKMGRIIMKRLKHYELEGQVNTGVQKMMKMLSDCNNKKSKSLVDGFNTYHLQSLFNIKQEAISRFNLKTTRKIFTETLRKEVLESCQIRGNQNKSLYLTTLKCSSLRFMNRSLANRLQNSESPQF